MFLINFGFVAVQIYSIMIVCQMNAGKCFKRNARTQNPKRALCNLSVNPVSASEQDQLPQVYSCNSDQKPNIYWWLVLFGIYPSQSPEKGDNHE